MTHSIRITASGQGQALTVYAGQVTASAASRTIGGAVVRYGTPGRTSAGRLRVRPGALRFPDDLGRVKLTREHDRDAARGHLVAVHDSAEGIRVTARVSDGPEGDAALTEARDRTRDGLSFDVVDAVVEGDELTDALVIAIGQVGIPAYDDSRIDQIAASNNRGENTMTEEQKRRLAELRAKDKLTPEEQADLNALVALEAASADKPEDKPEDKPADKSEDKPADQPGQPVQASIPAVPSGVPHTSGAQTKSRGKSLAQVVTEVTAAMKPGGGGAQAITAALSDIVSTDHTSTIEQPAWTGELWSGVQYEPEFTPLLGSGPLTNFEGRGWRFTQKLAIADYAGDKAAIPSGTVTTEPSTYEAARMAIGVDVDRKFYDFPNEGFVNSLFEQVRESYTIQLDAKVRAWIVAQAVAVLGADGITPMAQPTLLKAAARAVMALKRRRVGRATFIVVNDEDYFTLMDLAEKDVPKYLELWSIDPKNFVSSPDVAEGTVLAGVKQTGVVRTPPGFPVHVSAQAIANGGIDEAFFAYWAVEEHHTEGIASVQFEAPAA